MGSMWVERSRSARVLGTMLAAVVVAMCLVVVQTQSASATIWDDLGNKIVDEAGNVVGTYSTSGAEMVPAPGQGLSLGARAVNPEGLLVAGLSLDAWAWSNTANYLKLRTGKQNVSDWNLSGQKGGTFGIGDATTWGPYGADGKTTAQLSVKGSGASQTIDVSMTCTAAVTSGSHGFGCSGDNVFIQLVRASSGALWTCADGTTVSGTLSNPTNNNGLLPGMPESNSATGYQHVYAFDFTYANPCSAKGGVVGYVGPPQSGQTAYGLAWGTKQGSAYMTPLDPSAPVTFGSVDGSATCHNAETGEDETINWRSPWDESGGVDVATCKSTLGSDWYGTQLSLTPSTPTISGQAAPSSVSVPPLTWTQKDPSTAQACATTADGCALTLWIDNEPCTLGASEYGPCTRAAEIAQKHPEREECDYGSETVALDWCNVLMPQLKTGGAGGTSTTTSPVDGDQPDPDAGDDPGAGWEVSEPSGLPDPAQQADAQSCMPSGWGLLNPISWVEEPVKCAIEWAFKPDPSSWGVGDLVDTFQTHPPGSIVTGVTSMITGAVGSFGGGCGVVENWDIEGHAAAIDCTKIRASPGFTAIYDLVTIGLWVTTGLVLWNMFQGAFTGGGEED